MRARTLMAGLAAGALAAAGLVGAGTAADAAITTQPAGVSITVDSTGANTALVSSPTVANVTVKNNSASSTLGVFTVVVPAGVSSVQAVGVQGPGTWRQVVLPCGATANCSALVLVYASLPLNASLLRPGQSVTSSIRFTTPAAPTTLAFKFLGIGNGLFTTTDAPSINVVAGVAGSFCVSSPGNLVAGTTTTFTVQAIADGSECAPTGKKIGIAATSLTVKFGTDDLKGGIALGDVPGPLGGGSTVTFALPPSATGLYTFTGTFKAAGNTSIGVSTPNNGPGGNSTGFVVSPSVANKIVVNKVTPKDPTAPSLTSGAVFTTSYEVTDEFGNVILTPYTDVSISITGGTFKATGTGTNPVAGGAAPNGDPIAPVDGTVDGTFVGTGAQTLTASVGAVVSSTPITVSSDGTQVTFAAVSTGSVVLAPNVRATVVTSGFSVVGGQPACATGTTCGSLDLPAGGKGAATFVIDTCANTGIDKTTCGTDSAKVADFTGSLYADGTTSTPLYNAAAPAHLTYVCTNARCPHGVGIEESATEFTDTHVWEESVEDFNAYPFLYTTSLAPSVVRTAPACQTVALDKEHPQASVKKVPAGSNSCVDVTNLVRTPSGDLVFNVYFYDDYKGFVG